MLALAAGLSAPAAAQVLQAPSEQTGPASVDLGGMKLYPGVDLKFGRDDNLFLRPTNQTKSNLTLLSPNARLEARTGPHAFDLRYRSDVARYHASTADNYEDHLLQANGLLVFSGRADLRLRGEGQFAHDPRGSTDRAIAERPDRYRVNAAGGMFGYGARDAGGRVEFDGSQATRRYLNNLGTTEVANRDNTDLGATLFWRVAPRTRVLAQVRSMKVDYRLDTNQLDSTERRYYLGMQWEATAKTAGYVKLGGMKKDFVAGSRADITSTSWDLGVRWAPLEYSKFDVATSKSFAESTGLGDAIVSRRFTTAWTHGWSTRVSHTLSLGNTRDEFKGVARTDDTNSYGIRMNYQFRRWLGLGAELTHSVRSSDLPGFDYKRNLIFITANATL